jgi:hypothetical protein
MPGLPGAKIRKVMGETRLRLLAAFWGRVNEPQISQPTANSSCSEIRRSSHGRQAGAAGGYQDLVGRCSASSPADDTSRFGARHLEAHLRPYMFGAVCPVEGKAAALIMPVCNTAAMNHHLSEISSHVAADAHAVVILDRASWHRSQGPVVRFG